MVYLFVLIDRQGALAMGQRNFVKKRQRQQQSSSDFDAHEPTEGLFSSLLQTSRPVESFTDWGRRSPY